MIVSTPPAWTRDAAALLKQFLATGVGRVFLATLASQRPTLFTSNNIYAAALQGKLAAGYEKAIDNILALSDPPEDDKLLSDASLYKDLEDDTQWDDDGKDRFGNPKEPGAPFIPKPKKEPETLAEKSAAAEKAAAPTPE